MGQSGQQHSCSLGIAFNGIADGIVNHPIRGQVGNQEVIDAYSVGVDGFFRIVG